MKNGKTNELTYIPGLLQQQLSLPAASKQPLVTPSIHHLHFPMHSGGSSVLDHIWWENFNYGVQLFDGVNGRNDKALNSGACVEGKGDASDDDGFIGGGKNITHVLQHGCALDFCNLDAWTCPGDLHLFQCGDFKCLPVLMAWFYWQWVERCSWYFP